MINKTFFHFVLGFIGIVFGSLTFLFFLGFYETEFSDGNTANTSGTAILKEEGKKEILNNTKNNLPSESMPAPKKVSGEDERPQLE